MQNFENYGGRRIIRRVRMRNTLEKSNFAVYAECTEAPFCDVNIRPNLCYFMLLLVRFVRLL